MAVQKESEQVLLTSVLKSTPFPGPVRQIILLWIWGSIAYTKEGERTTINKIQKNKNIYLKPTTVTTSCH